MRPYHVEEVLITPRRLARRVDEVAREIAQFLPAIGEPTHMPQPTQPRG